MAAGSPLERIQRTFRPDDHSAPREARQALAAFNDLHPELVVDLSIVVSELVANAIRHAPQVVGGEVTVSIARDDDGIYIEVRDPGNGFDPTPDRDREGGLGLKMVNRLADSWGIEGDPQTTIWCHLRTAR